MINKNHAIVFRDSNITFRSQASETIRTYDKNQITGSTSVRLSRWLRLNPAPDNYIGLFSAFTLFYYPEGSEND